MTRQLHKRLFTKVIFLICGVLLVAGLGVIGQSRSGSIVFLDGGLESAVRDKIDNPHDAISRASLLQVTRLDASDHGIISLEGIEHLVRLESLDLSNNHIRDLTPLQGATRLFDLNLDNNKILCLKNVNFRSLSGIPLRKLSLRNNVVVSHQGQQDRLSDIRLLQEFLGLEELSLRDNAIVDISPIAFLPKIQRLDLRGNHVSDIRPLENLYSLRHLNLRDNFLDDLSPLSLLTGLEYLNIHSNPRIRCIEPLSHLEHLQVLILRYVPAQGQLHVFEQMRSLRYLNIRNCGITDINRLMDIAGRNNLYDTIDQQASASIRINEVMASDGSDFADDDGDYPGWIELYNFGDDAVDLTGWGLSDRKRNPFKWTFPQGTSIEGQGYLLIWTSGKDREGENLHANFSISNLGEEVVLTTSQGLRVDFLPAVAIPSGLSIGRHKDSFEQWVYLKTPTPLRENHSVAYEKILAPVQFSRGGGFYTEDIILELSHDDPEVVIVYTTDGSIPCIDNLEGTSYFYRNSYAQENDEYSQDLLERRYYSQIYKEPLCISNRSSDPDVLTQISSTRDSTPGYFPSSPVRKATVVQARAFKKGALASRSSGNTYFVEPEGNPYSVPVISLQIQENFLFDYEKGTYNAGVDFIPGDKMTGNYFRRGRPWEYPLHVEIFYPEHHQAVISQNAGFRIHGHTSRYLPLKNLRIYARGRYDSRREFQYDFFDEEVALAVSPQINRYKRLLLRGAAGGPGWFANDVVHTRLMQPVFEGMVRIKPAVHFINGEYWGYTTIRDRFDRYHIGYHYDIDPENVIFVKQGELSEGELSDMDSYNDMIDFITKNDMSDDMMFAQVEEMLCLRSYADHQIINIYSHNSHYESGFWRAREPSDQYFADGRWRAYIQDFDATYQNARWLQIWKKTDPVFSRLLRNQKFRYYFINRFADHINSTFRSKRFISVIEHAYDEVEDLLKEHRHRLNDYEATPSHEQLFPFFHKRFITSRAGYQPSYQRDHIRQNFDIDKNIQVKIEVSDPSHGYVRINTIDIQMDTPGISRDPYPWTGVYFCGIPIQVKAVPSQGYVFTGWQIIEGDIHGESNIRELFYTEQSIDLVLWDNAVIKAIFE